ncbi:hypothetical protein LCGC14_1520310, partial [marine sediment metagenome]
MLYFKIFNSDNLDEIGHYPQTKLKAGYNPSLPESHWQVKSNEFPDFIPNYELELHEKAVPTNLIDPASGSFGLVVDSKLKTLFQEFNLPPHHFYPIKIYQKSKLLDYYWMHFIISDFWENIDMDKSTLRIQSNTSKDIYIILPVLSKEYVEKLSLYYLHKYEYTLFADKLYFKDSFQIYDIIDIEFLEYTPLISAR